MDTRDNLKDTLESPYKYIPEISGLGDFLCCFFLVFGYSHFLIQIIPILFFKGILAYLHFKKKEMYKSKLDYNINLGNTLLILVVLIVFLSYYIIRPYLSVQARYTIFGNLMIYLFMLMMLFNLICGIVAIVTELREYCLKTSKASSEQIIQFRKNNEEKMANSPKISLGKKNSKQKIKLNRDKSKLISYSNHRYNHTQEDILSKVHKNFVQNSNKNNCKLSIRPYQKLMKVGNNSYDIVPYRSITKKSKTQLNIK